MAGTAAVARDGGELDRRRLALVAAQAGGLRWPIAACVLVIAAIVAGDVPPAVVAGWVAAAVGARELRARRLRGLADDEATPVARRLASAVRSNALLGGVHGSAAFFMPWLDTTQAALLTMVLMSWAAGAASTGAPLLRLYLVFAAGLFVPTAAMWLAAGTPLGAGIALLVLMFAAVQYRFASHDAQVFEESHRIRAVNDDLLRQLAEARDLAEAASRAKSRFLAAASHDLRQPLHALTLHSGLLAQDPQAHDAPAIAAEMSTAIESLGKLLDSLLHISKLDAGVMAVERRPIKLHRLIAQLVRTHAPQAAEKRIELRFDCPMEAVVATDPLLLERLLRNLLDNAIKYTDRGEVCVLVTPADDGLLVCVRDTGRGIAPAAQQRVFEEFYRIDDPSQPHSGGLGLGLAIVRRLAQLLGLALSLQSEPGRGTCISVRLPCAAGFADAPEVPAAAPDALRGARVLFIDDEEAVRSAMRKVLERFGCIACEATGSDDAIEQAQHGHPPDLVLADCRLRAGDSGIAAIARLRESLPGLPAMLISGDTDGERLREAERSGVPLLHKPLSLAQLRRAMDSLLRERGAAQGQAA